MCSGTGRTSSAWKSTAIRWDTAAIPVSYTHLYRDKMLPVGAKPNAAHKKLAELEAAGKLKAVVTQNIDGLHQAAGSRVVYEPVSYTHLQASQTITPDSIRMAATMIATIPIIMVYPFIQKYFVKGIMLGSVKS